MTIHSLILNLMQYLSTFYSNKIISAKKEGFEIDQDSTSKNSAFSKSELVNSESNNTSTIPTHEKTNSEIRGKGE
jgi:hypothetical protein